MFTLDIKKHRRIYLVLSIICLIFSFLYEYFSHGVVSVFMILPGFVVFISGYIILPIIHQFLNRLVFSLFNMFLMTFVVGMYIKGILDIYGTTNELVYIYFIVAIFLLIQTIAFLLESIYNERKSISKSRTKISNNSRTKK